MVKMWSSLGNKVDFKRSRNDPHELYGQKSQKKNIYGLKMCIFIDLTFDVVNSIPFLSKFTIQLFNLFANLNIMINNILL